ncbi:diacylglycerol kinase 1 [Artemisia annua]|uniref:Diacylglycerol kinase 1 n=1 Tax=Artemisia annua TaxID=35608 RepID=A0A2U1QP73_ARTAN|nr:diacylglycerol kinase 1 [Artemisia annua]
MSLLGNGFLRGNFNHHIHHFKSCRDKKKGIIQVIKVDLLLIFRSGSTSFSTGEIGGVEGPYGAVDRRLYMGNLHFNMTEVQLKHINYVSKSLERFSEYDSLELHLKGDGHSYKLIVRASRGNLMKFAVTTNVLGSTAIPVPSLLLLNSEIRKGCQRHVLIANIGSYMGGVDLWHNKNEGADNFDLQSKHDNRLEVMSISATWHLGKLHVIILSRYLITIHY